jgi:hypothetical protein
MDDYNHNGKFDREDFVIMEDDDHMNHDGNTTVPLIVVTLIVVGILAVLKLL